MAIFSSMHADLRGHFRGGQMSSIDWIAPGCGFNGRTDRRVPLRTMRLTRSPFHWLAVAWMALAICIPVRVMAAPYGSYDLRQLLIPAPAGGTGGTFSRRYLDAMLDDIAQHAANYPPQFDSAADRQRAQRDVTNLMGMLDTAFGATGSPPEILLRMGILGAAGHNLDIPNAAAYAEARFGKLLSASPEHPLANYHYGQLLAGSGRLKEAMPYLFKARDKGVVPASYTLGIAHLGLGDQQKALVYLGEYQKAQPADQNVGKLILAIREGTVEVRKTGGLK